MKTLKLVTLILLVLTFNACTKTGPAGPAGTNGSANIQTYLFTTTNTNWSVSNNAQTSTWNSPAITQAVIDKGTVQLFNGNNTGLWVAMPYSYKNEEYNFVISVGQILITVTNGDGTVPANPGGQQFKEVVIPGQ